MATRTASKRRRLSKSEPGFLGVSLHIWGRFDPADIAEPLGLDTIISDRRGTIVGRTRIRHDYLLVGFKPNSGLDAMLMDLARRVRHVPIAIRRRFARTPGPMVEISVERDASEQTSDFLISPATLKSLAALGITLAICVH